jgi:quercetin dioxygenase-like cupin family protein
VQNSSIAARAREQLNTALMATSGRSANTVYGGHDHALCQTVIALAAGQTLEDHANPGEATVYVLQGRVRLVAADASWEGSAGDLLVVPECSHSLHAIENAAVLLTVAKSAR